MNKHGKKRRRTASSSSGPSRHIPVLFLAFTRTRTERSIRPSLTPRVNSSLICRRTEHQDTVLPDHGQRADTAFGITGRQKTYLYSRRASQARCLLSPETVHAPFYLTDMYDRGIVIFPYHRLVRFSRKRSLQELMSTLQPFMKIEKLPFNGTDSLGPVLNSVSPPGTLPSRFSRRTILVISTWLPKHRRCRFTQTHPSMKASRS